MAGELNTEITDDPEQCRTWADYARDANSAVKSVGDTAYRLRGESESYWQGTAADAARAAITDNAQDADKLEQSLDRIQGAMNTFARQVDTARSRMNQARQVASKASLIVTGTTILPPGPGPGPAPTRPTGPVNPQEESQIDTRLAQYQAEADAFAAKQEAFNEASATVTSARQIQQDAHHALEQAMDDPLGTVKSIKSYTMYALSGALSQAKGRQTMANDLMKSAGDVEEHANRMQAIADDPASSSETRAAAAKAAATAEDGVAGTRAQADRIGLKAPGWVRTTIEANPGNYIGEVDNGAAKLGKGLLRGVPFLGTGLAIASGAADYATGTPLEQAAAETGANIAGGAAGGVAGAEIGGMIGTLICPGVGTAVGGVLGGVVGGMIGGVGATAATDYAMDAD